MSESDFQNKRIAVLGFGVEGRSLVRFLLDKEAKVTVLDEKKTLAENANEFREFTALDVSYKFGPFSDLDKYDLVVVSPGIRFDRPVIINAQKAGVIITTATNIFMDLCPCQVIGVTGTKGKGTTSSLITEMFKTDGRDAYLGGNIGTAPLDFLDKLSQDSVVVLELSSFQTFNMTKSPHIAVIIMVTSEHLDYHLDTNEYVMAKANLVLHQKPGDFVVYNQDYPNSAVIGKLGKSAKYLVSTKKIAKNGTYVKDAEIYFTQNGETEKIIDCKDIFIPGKHNWENVAAAITAAKVAGISTDSIKRSIEKFKGLPHRIEFVREISGVKYYDDSFSTVPETAIAAIEAFSQPKVLILGGSSKNSDFTELGKVISQSHSIRAIVGIGVEWVKIKEKIEMNEINEKNLEIIEGCKNMKEIVETAKKVAQSGDVVLLTPACASFDMFKNYKDRGEQFKKCILNLE
jgi:UDP-N-acetylmuramoylalanine--D-glutamate ligase